VSARERSISRLERAIGLEHGDRFAIVAVRSVHEAAAPSMIVADVTLVFGDPWTLVEHGPTKVLGHAGFELPLDDELLATLRTQPTVLHLRATLLEAARLRYGDDMARRFLEELKHDGRAIPAQLREVSAVLRARDAASRFCCAIAVE
jgi:hypothetical protein